MAMKRVPRIIAAFSTSSAWGRELMSGVSAFAMQRGRWHCNFTTSSVTENTIRWAKEVDGILASTAVPELAEALAKLKIPVVMLGFYNPFNLPCVHIDSGANT